MSIYVTAAPAKRDIVVGDLVSKGPQFNTIPLFSAEYAEVCPTEKSRFPRFVFNQKIQRASSFHSGNTKQQSFTMQSSHHLPHAKSSGYFLVLVPVIAICIGCITNALRNRIGNLECEVTKKSQLPSHETRSMRWKYALTDEREDILGAESRPASNNLREDEDQVSYEEIPHDYSKLEDDYQKFLSECGINEWGYWRGGSSK